MPTKLSRYCEGLIEATWLAAVLVVPIFFNVFSSRIFEPDKITLLRSLALLILGAWLVKLVDEGGVRWEKVQPRDSFWKTLASIPLLIPVAALAVLYLISTIFSVSPATSLLGSYQRLQGTYTTFSYLVIFAALMGNLRRREQVERLITAIIVASLPVSLYGILQRYGLDPVPWGGDVVRRIASNLGNSIFVAAYLIMVFALTLMRIIASFRDILSGNGRLWANFTRATVYVFIAALQLIAIFFSGSRGPWLGLLSSTFFLLLALSVLWNKRPLTLGIVGVSLALMSFLVILNIPNGPLQELRTRPGFNRLGELLAAESRTGQVRTLIWQGAAELVLPHEPLEFPDGRRDTWNFLRPLIGYGPESMYVAYNPFYPPELTQVEKRNASPDRSHNETWDSLVITGVLGLGVYLALFLSVFYYGFKWLGLVNGPGQRRLFLGLAFGMGILSALVLVLWQGTGYFGVSLPFGVILGLLAYLAVVAVFGHPAAPRSENDKLRTLLLVGLLSAILAHFVEINFGIAIAATRTYFWAFAVLLVLVGWVLPQHEVFTPAAEVEPIPAAAADEPAMRRERKGAAAAKLRTASDRRASAGRRKRQASGRSSSGNLIGARAGSELRNAMPGVLILGIILATLGFNLITNSQGEQRVLAVLWSSLTHSRTGDGPIFGVLAMLAITWIAGGLLITAESAASGETNSSSGSGWAPELRYGRVAGSVLGGSLFAGLLFWLLHSGALAGLASTAATNLDDVITQIRRYEGLLTRYYLYLFLLLLAGAAFLPSGWPVKAPARGRPGRIVAPFALAVVAFLISYTNLRIIQADIAFKLADSFTRTQQWPVAIAIYNRANDLAPSEDFYYLFLGRAYLEQAKTITDVAERDALMAQAAADLQKAQSINPLNTDHTANLARLHSLWASYTSDPEMRQQRAEVSAEYFRKAVTLSPNNARLWDEWAMLELNVLQQPEDAFPYLQRAVEVDPYYDVTYSLLGDYYLRSVQQLPETETEERTDLLQKAAEQYSKALELVSGGDPQVRYAYSLSLGAAQAQLDRHPDAIAAYQQALEANPQAPDRWRIEEAIAQLYFERGDVDRARQYLQQALEGAPEDQKARLQSQMDVWGQ